MFTYVTTVPRAPDVYCGYITIYCLYVHVYICSIKLRLLNFAIKNKKFVSDLLCQPLSSAYTVCTYNHSIIKQCICYNDDFKRLNKL